MFGKKGKLIVLMMMFFVSIFIISCSCAKKEVKPPEAVTTPVPTKKEKTTVAPNVEQKPKVTMEELKAQEEAKKKAEAAKKLQEEIKEFESTMIHFDFDKSELKPKAREILKKKAEWLLKHPEFNVRIEGYCDERGTEEYNLALGQRRADAAKKYLIELGVPADRISTISYGEENPIDPRHCEAAWAKNRRDEFKLIKRTESK